MTLNLLVWCTSITHRWRSSSMMQKVHLFLPTFSTSFNPFRFQVQTIHKINQILLISLQILAKIFASNIIIDLSYNLSNCIQFEVFENCLKWVAYINTLFSPCYRLGRNGKFLKCLRILIAVVYFKDRKWIWKTVYWISSLVVCKIAFYFEFPDIPDSTGRKIRRRTQAIAKRYAFHANAKSVLKMCSKFKENTHTEARFQ